MSVVVQPYGYTAKRAGAEVNIRTREGSLGGVRIRRPDPRCPESVMLFDRLRLVRGALIGA